MLMLPQRISKLSEQTVSRNKDIQDAASEGSEGNEEHAVGN